MILTIIFDVCCRGGEFDILLLNDHAFVAKVVDLCLDKTYEGRLASCALVERLRRGGCCYGCRGKGSKDNSNSGEGLHFVVLM